MDQKLEGRGCPRRSFIVEERFLGPASFRGVPGSGGRPTRLGHLVIWAALGRVAITGETSASCPAPQPLGAVQIDGTTGRLYSCKSGFAAPNSGHVLLAWTQDGATYGVGSHGHTATSRRLVVEIARNLDFVRAG